MLNFEQNDLLDSVVKLNKMVKVWCFFFVSLKENGEDTRV